VLPIGSALWQRYVMAATANSLVDARQALGECVLFHGLTVEQRTALVARAPTRTFAPGQIIFLMGAPGDTMMAVLSGSVRISVPTPDGKEIVLAILERGDVFGEIALLDGKERTAEATAMTACSVAILNRREVLSFLDRHPGAWLKIVQVLCGRLRNTDQHIAELALLKLPARLAKALLRLANAQSRAANGGAGLHVRLSQHQIANVCGTTRESINKCLRAWQRRGLVEIGKNLITVADRTALEELAEGTGQPCSTGDENCRGNARLSREGGGAGARVHAIA
jgi:CRP/FNR family cyclic AMP-dependent transcriptional regulator